MTQCDKILRHLQDYGSISPLEAFNEYGCLRLAARIADLKADGHNITSVRTTSNNRYGEKVSYSVYFLA